MKHFRAVLFFSKNHFFHQTFRSLTFSHSQASESKHQLKFTLLAKGHNFSTLFFSHLRSHATSVQRENNNYYFIIKSCTCYLIGAIQMNYFSSDALLGCDMIKHLPSLLFMLALQCLSFLLQISRLSRSTLMQLDSSILVLRDLLVLFLSYLHCSNNFWHKCVLHKSTH